MSDNVFVRLLVPDWLLRLGPTRAVRDIRLAFDELEVRSAVSFLSARRVTFANLSSVRALVLCLCGRGRCTCRR